MPYYIYQIEQSAGAVIKRLQLTYKCDDYRQAKVEIRKLRDKQPQQDKQQWKMVFAESELQAEELLQEKREAPVLMEWEK